MVLISEEEEVTWKGMVHVVTEASWETGVNCRGLEGKEQGHCARGLPRSHHLFLGKKDSGYCGFMVCADVFTGGTTFLFFLSFCIHPRLLWSPPLVLDPEWLDAKK